MVGGSDSDEGTYTCGTLGIYVLCDFIQRRRIINIGKSSTCHTERKTIKREERLAVNMALLADMGANA